MTFRDSHWERRYQELLYAKGFLITRSSTEVPEHWTESHLGGFRLYRDPRLPVAIGESGPAAVAVLGMAMDLGRGLGGTQEIARHLADRLVVSRESFNEAVDWLCGRFIIVARDSSEITVQTDAAGLAAVYYSRRDEVGGSHARLVAEACGEPKPSRFADPVWETGNSVSYLPGVATIYDGVYQLTPNTELRLESMSPRRIYPRTPLTSRRVGDVVEELVPLLRSQVEMLSQMGRDLILSLTAGIDSRTSLALVRPIVDEVRIFTYSPQFGRFTALPIVGTDRVVARDIAHNLHLEMLEAVIVDDRVDPALRSILETNIHHEHIWPLAQWYVENLPPDTLQIRSNLYEIGRAFYRKARPRQLPLTAERMAIAHRSQPPSSEEAVAAFEEFIEVTGFEEFEGFDPYDLLYWEHRMGRWHANVVAESDLSHDTWVLFNCRRILALLLSVPLEARLEAAVYHSLIRTLWPELARWPVNTGLPSCGRRLATVGAVDDQHSGRISVNDDRISEVYKGEIWTDEAKERARRRINWMIGQVKGDRVLDVGCSQGIASILLGREGFEVVGVDVQESRIAYADADLALEAEATRKRVHFVVGEGSSLDFEDDSFDTVLLGEVIEHLAAPQRVLAEVRRVLRPGGVVVITTPFGVLHHHDHKQTFYSDDVVALISDYFGVVEAEVADRYFRIVAEKGAESDVAVLESLRDSADSAVRGIQEELADLRIQVKRLSTEIETSAKARNQSEKRAELLEKRLADAKRSKERVETAWRGSKTELREAKESLQELRASLRESEAARSETENRYRSLAAELKRAGERANAAARTSEELERVRKRLARRERDNAKLRYRVEVRDWKLASLRRRRWWMLGAELAKSRRRPSTLPLLPLRLLKVMRTKHPPLPRPSPPSGPSKEDSQGKGIKTESGAPPPGTAEQPIIPRRDLPALGVVSSGLRESLASEVLLMDLDPDPEAWRSQIESVAPSVLIVDSAAPDLPSSIDITTLLTAAEAAGIRTVLFDREPSALPASTKSRFHAICGDGKYPLDDYEGRLIERRGWIQPRIHNPIGAHRRSGATAVDPSNHRLAQAAFRGATALTLEAKRYRVLRAIGDVEDPDLAPIVATATPLIVTAQVSELGLSVESDEEAEAMEKSILRSDVLGPRLAHPLMRKVMREHSFSADLDAVLGVQEERWPRIDVMVATKRLHKIETIFENLGRQTYPNFAVWLVAHGIDVDRERVQDLAARAGVDLAAVVDVDESVILGEVFNIGFGETESEVVAKIDDDDFYGPEYLWDLYTALDFSGAEVAGKWAHYVHLEGVDSMVYRFKDYEHRFTDVVAISTLLMRRDVLEVERFPAMPWGSGSVFLRALGAQGGRVFAADRWNYLYLRGRDGVRNTFPISDLKMLANSEIICRGMNFDEVIL